MARWISRSKKKIAGFELKAENFQKLDSDEWFDDDIMNAFVTAITSEARDRSSSILSFDVFCTQRIILTGKMSLGFQKWVTKTSVLDYKVWLLPVINNSHWRLLVVDFEKEIFLYIDSLHGRPPQVLLNGYISLIDHEMKTLGKVLDWDDWQLHCPIDIPNQNVTTDGKMISTGDCGVHVCTWGYIICSRSPKPFFTEDIPWLRKSIAHYIIKAKEEQNYPMQQSEYNKYLVDSDDADSSKLCPVNFPIKSRMIKKPPLDYNSTFEYCANLCQ